MRVLLHMGDPYVLDNPCTKRIKAFASELIKRGHEAIILAPDTPGIERVDGVVYCRTVPLKKKSSLYRLLNQGGFALSSLKKGMKIREVDVVLTTCPPPLINMSAAHIARKKRARLIYDVRDIWPDVALEMGSFSEDSFYANSFSFIRDYMLKNADLVTAVSNGKVRKLKNYGYNDNVICVPNGFNNSFLDVEISQELLREIRSRDRYICTYIGNIGLAQGIMQLLDLAERAKEKDMPVSFLIYGSGAEEAQLKRHVLEKKLDNVSFEGRIANSGIRTVLEASDISFVSLVNGNLKDSVPTKLYEALGVGCPVLLVAEGDSADVLRDTGHGRAVSPNDSQGIFEAFVYMIDHLEDYKRNEQHCKKLILTKYSLAQSSKIIVDLMENMVDKK